MKRIFLIFLVSFAVLFYLQKIDIFKVNMLKADISSNLPFLLPQESQKNDNLISEESTEKEPAQNYANIEAGKPAQNSADIEAGKENAEPENNKDSKQMTLEEIQEAIDNIKEEVDIWLAENIAITIENVATPDFELAEKKDDKKTEEQKPEEDLENKIYKKNPSVGGGGGETPPKPEIVFCEKSSASPSRNSVIFNEIAWAGTANSANDEWLEFKNIGSNDIDLTSWQIQDKNNDIKISFPQKNISAGAFFLLERTNDDSVPGIFADYIFTGALNDENEELYLFDKNCQIQDYILASPDWRAGNKEEKRTMETSDDLTWHTYSGAGQNGIMGTPKAENSRPFENPVSTPDADLVILINEVQTASSIDEKEEFVELYNPNEIDVDLTGWYLQRKTKTGSSYSRFASHMLFDNKMIKAMSYFLIARIGSLFANLADILVDNPLTDDNSLIIKNLNQDISDKVGWGQAQDFETASITNPLKGKSIERKGAGQDTNDNSQDFEIKEIPTPTNSKGETVASSDDY